MKDLLDLASVILKDQGNKEDLEALLQLIKNEIEVSLIQRNFQLVFKNLKALHKIRVASKNEKPFAVQIFNNFINMVYIVTII